MAYALIVLMSTIALGKCQNPSTLKDPDLREAYSSKARASACFLDKESREARSAGYPPQSHEFALWCGDRGQCRGRFAWVKFN